LESYSEDDDANIPDLVEDPSHLTPLSWWGTPPTWWGNIPGLADPRHLTPPTWWEGDSETDSEPDADMPGLESDSESDDDDAIPPLESVTWVHNI
jgi:hypothetical protein